MFKKNHKTNVSLILVEEEFLNNLEFHFQQCNILTYSDSSKKTLRDVGHNDTNEEDDSFKPMVAQDEGNDEESHTEENSHSGDDMDKMGNLLSNGGFSDFKT